MVAKSKIHSVDREKNGQNMNPNAQNNTTRGLEPEDMARTLD